MPLAFSTATQSKAVPLRRIQPGSLAVRQGTAIADVLFGDYNPAGRLPVTFYKSADQLPPFEDYDMRGRTYRYFQGEPLYPFGFGLSYTRFTYRLLTVPKTASAKREVRIQVEVQNAGKLAGEEVVQLYLKRRGEQGTVPIRSLEGFERIALRPGEKKFVEFILTPRQLRRREMSRSRWEASSPAIVERRMPPPRKYSRRI